MNETAKGVPMQAMYDEVTNMLAGYCQLHQRCLEAMEAMRKELDQLRQTNTWIARNIAMATVYLACTDDPIPPEVRKKLEVCLYGHMGDKLEQMEVGGRK